MHGRTLCSYYSNLQITYYRKLAKVQSGITSELDVVARNDA